MQALLPRATSGRAALGSSVSRVRRPHSTAATTPSPIRLCGAVLSSPGQGLPSHASLRRRYRRFGHGIRTLITDERAKASRKAPPFAFAFDIDGVLLHVAKPIPGAPETLAYLQENNIPFILLTNGGGKHESERVADLSARLGVKLTTDNFVQSHTPFQELVAGSSTTFPGSPALRDRNILVTGSDAEKARRIAERYGFRHVITPADILAAHPAIYPFDPLMREVYAATARPLPSPRPKIDAIFVFNDARDWALDSQVIADLLLSEAGVLGTYSARNGRADLPAAGWQSDGQPRLFFSNPDLFWSAAYHLPRFGQGAFQAALAGIWDRVTAGRAPLRRTTIGKPYRETYAYAERVLGAHRARVLGLGTGAGGEGEGEVDGKGGGAAAAAAAALRTVYMVGDNPESDIRGANEYESPAGTRWVSALVRTGVWNPERGAPAHEPGVVVDDVKAAVEWALRKEGWEGIR